MASWRWQQRQMEVNGSLFEKVIFQGIEGKRRFTARATKTTDGMARRSGVKD